MVYDETKKIIIVKNIPSNLVEEAILILKGNSKNGEKGSKDSEYKKTSTSLRRRKRL